VSSSTSRSAWGLEGVLRLAPPCPHTAALRFKGAMGEISFGAILTLTPLGEGTAIERSLSCG